MDAKERLEKIKLIAKHKIETFKSLNAESAQYEWQYVLNLLTDDSWLNERYDFYALCESDFDKKYPNIYD